MPKSILQVLLPVAGVAAGWSLMLPTPSQQRFDAAGAAAVHPTYVTRVQQMPVPTDEATRKDFCGGLREDRAQKVSGIRAPRHVDEGAADLAPPGDVGAAAMGLGEAIENADIERKNRELRQEIAAIDQKMADAACDLPHMPAGSAKRTGAEL